MMDKSTPGSASPCEAFCDVVGTQVACDLKAGHEHEHEASDRIDIEVYDPAGSGTLTPFLVWWGDDGHAFVGSNKAVDTGRTG